MKIDYVHFPFVFTDNGQKIPITEIDGHPKVGSELILDQNTSSTIRYKLSAVTSDSECVNGVCPVR